MKKISYFDGAALLIWLLPILYVWYNYPSLSASVPMHYNLAGKVDRYGSKSEFLMFQFLMMGAAAFVYVLLKFIPSIDPKKKIKYGDSTVQKLMLGIVVFLSALDIGIVYATIHHGVDVGKLVLPITGLLFAFMGNIMHSIKPNYFAGFKTPWALESEDNWRATHRIAGRVWFGGGIVIAAATLFLPTEAASIVFSCGILVLVLVPFIYSYLYFKNHGLS